MKLNALALVILMGCILGLGPVVLGNTFWFENSLLQRTPEIEPVSNKEYNEECGDCHFAYQPGLLPARSWRKVMAGLEDHFGDNAELASDTQANITDFLTLKSADVSSFRRSKRIMNSMNPASTMIRITSIPYIKRKHNRLAPSLIEQSESGSSLSYCDACHTKASVGSYSEREIEIKGYGKWETKMRISSLIGSIFSDAQSN